MSWAKKTALLHGGSVSIQAALNAFDLWVVDVSVQGEAMADRVLLGKFATESINRVLLIGIVILKNYTNGLESLSVLIGPLIPVVERIWICWLPITRGEVYCDCDSDLTPTKNVVEEGILFIDANVGDR